MRKRQTITIPKPRPFALFSFAFFCSGLVCSSILSLSPSTASAASIDNTLITQDLVDEIREFIDRDIVRLSIQNQNEKYNNLDQSTITALDEQWVAERAATNKPLISATLSNPLSAYLTRVQAHSKGLYTEIFVMDKNGLNVGQSNLSSDFWQGDEAKFQKTFPIGPTTIFIDDAEFNDESHTWNAQVNISVADESGTKPIGAATIEVNLTELQRRKAAEKIAEQTAGKKNEQAPAPEAAPAAVITETPAPATPTE